MTTLESGIRTLRPAHGGAFDVEVRRAERASGSPALVFVPGVAGPRGTFHHQIAGFARDRDVVAIDLNPAQARGMDAVESAALDILCALDALGLERVDLLGASFGACAVARFGSMHPERVRRAVWVVPPVVQSGTWREAFGPGWLVGGALLKFSPVRTRRAVARWVASARLYSPEPDLDEHELELLAARAKHLALGPFLRRYRGLRSWDWGAMPAPYPVPAVVVQGRTEHEATPRDAVEAWTRLTGRPVAVVPGRHLPYLSHPGEFDPVVREFLGAA